MYRRFGKLNATSKKTSVGQGTKQFGVQIVLDRANKGFSQHLYLPFDLCPKSFGLIQSILNTSKIDLDLQKDGALELVHNNYSQLNMPNLPFKPPGLEQVSPTSGQSESYKHWTGVQIPVDSESKFLTLLQATVTASQSSRQSFV